MQLYDTARGGVFALEAGPIVTIYSCGITPYDAAHLGHAYVYLCFDLLQRRLRDAGHETRCVRNVTDVDDDMLRKSRELGVNYLDLAAQEMARFDRDMQLINLLPVYAEPRATGAIPEILTMIGRTFDAGIAYEVDGSVYFEVSKFPRFGQVSHEDRVAMLELAAVHGGPSRRPEQARPAGLRALAAVAGGRAGLGVALGCRSTGLAHRVFGHRAARPGRDPRRARRGTRPGLSRTTSAKRPRVSRSPVPPFVKHWMHVGLVGLDGTKMSKSLGNLVFVEELASRAEPTAVRLALLDHHYRDDWEWRDELLSMAQSRLATWRSTLTNGRPSSVRGRRTLRPRRRPRQPGGAARDRRRGARRLQRRPGRFIVRH